MTRLEKLTHAALLVLSVFSLLVLTKNQFPSFLGSVHSNATRRTSWVGEHISIPGIDWHDTSQNVLIGLRSDCPFCKASMPGYRKLAGLRRAGQNIRVYVVSAENERVTSDFLIKSGLSVDGVRKIDMASFGMLSTPTVYIVDNSGIVRNEFIGSGEDADILAKVDSPIHR